MGATALHVCTKRCYAILERTLFHPIKRTNRILIDSLDRRAQIDRTIRVVAQKCNLNEGHFARVESQLIILQTNIRNYTAWSGC